MRSKSNQSIASKTDSELVLLVKEDPANLGKLIERWEKPLFFFIQRISYFPKEEIEDILQETFLKVYKNINSFDPEFKFSTWLYRIARNQTIDAMRKNKHEFKNPSLNDEEFIQVFPSSSDLFKEAASKDCVEKIHQVIQGLPLKYREALVLRFIEEKNYEEISDILKKPKGTIATLIKRGREILTERMKKRELDCA